MFVSYVCWELSPGAYILHISIYYYPIIWLSIRLLDDLFEFSRMLLKIFGAQLVMNYLY